jgi:hypothetical protein
MSETRQTALWMALELKERLLTPESIVNAAGQFHAFLEAVGAPEQPAVPQKPAPRKRASPSQDAGTPAASGASSAEAHPAPESGKTAAPAQEPSSASPSPVDVFSDEKPTPPASDAPAATIEQVRAALVAVQTKDGKKDRAFAELQKLAPTLSALKAEDYGKLIAACNALLK